MGKKTFGKDFPKCSIRNIFASLIKKQNTKYEYSTALGKSKQNIYCLQVKYFTLAEEQKPKQTQQSFTGDKTDLPRWGFVVQTFVSSSNKHLHNENKHVMSINTCAVLH